MILREQAWLRRPMQTLLEEMFESETMTYTKANSTHTDHGNNIQPGALEPLAESRSPRHW